VSVSLQSNYEIVDAPIWRKIRVFIPVIDNDWEKYHSIANPGSHPALVSREICDVLRLHVNPQTSEFYEDDGTRASQVVEAGDPWKARQEFIYLKRICLIDF